MRTGIFLLGFAALEWFCLGLDVGDPPQWYLIMLHAAGAVCFPFWAILALRDDR